MTEYRYYINRRSTKRKGVAVYLYVRVNKKQERHLIGHDLTEKEVNMLALQKCQDIYRNIQRLVTVSQAFTLNDALELYRRVAELKNVTDMKRVESIADVHLIPFFGANLTLADLQAEDGLKYLAHRKQRAAQGTIAREWSFFMRLLNLAVDYEKIPRNRLKVIDVPKGDSRNRVATLEELQALQAVAIPELFQFVMVACHVGLRESMILKIETQWVSAQEDGWWLLMPKPRTQMKRHAPKIPLNAEAMKALFPDGFNVPQGRIFARWKNASSLKHLWARTCARAGIVNLHIHDLRHTFATWLQNTGAPYEVRQVLLGHRMPGTTEIYSHGGKGFDSQMRQAVDKLASTYGLGLLDTTGSCKSSCKSSKIGQS